MGIIFQSVARRHREYPTITMNQSPTVRTMREEDIHAVLEIQANCYTELQPESAESLLAKLDASPSTCFIASIGQRQIGYLISIPWRRSSPPLLNTPTCQLPGNPDCLYLHDLSVHPASRGSNAGQLLIAAFMEQFAALRLHCAVLVAVQGSAAYWQHHGFHVLDPSQELATKLSSYGSNVQYMMHSTPDFSSKDDVIFQMRDSPASNIL